MDKASNTLWLEQTVQVTGSIAYGSPQAIWVSLTVPAGAAPLASGLPVQVLIFNKTSTRMPEAM